MLGSGRLLGSNEISFSSDGSNATFRSMFKVSIFDIRGGLSTLSMFNALLMVRVFFLTKLGFFAAFANVINLARRQLK
jgi:hypothetical protein